MKSESEESTSVEHPVEGEIAEEVKAETVQVKVEFQKEPIVVNIVEDEFPSGSKLKKLYQPTEKACYSHSPPDMKLEVYNKKRHNQTFRKDHSLLYDMVKNLSKERSDPNYRPKQMYDGVGKKSRNPNG